MVYTCRLTRHESKGCRARKKGEREKKKKKRQKESERKRGRKRDGIVDLGLCKHTECQHDNLRNLSWVKVTRRQHNLAAVTVGQLDRKETVVRVSYISDLR